MTPESFILTGLTVIVAMIGCGACAFSGELRDQRHYDLASLVFCIGASIVGFTGVMIYWIYG